MRLRGYDYGGVFQGINKSDTKANTGELDWVGNWVSFMDTMLQFSIMGKDLRELYLPTRIEKVILNPQKHLNILEGTKTSLPCYMYKDINVIKCGGVEMRGLKASLAPKKSGAQTPKLEKYCFVPNYIQNSNNIGDNSERAKQYAYSIATHLVLENSNGALKLKVAEYLEDRLAESSNAIFIQDFIEGEPTLASEVALVVNQKPDIYQQYVGESGVRVVVKDATKGAIEQNCHLAVGYDLLTINNGETILKNLKNSIKEDGFIMIEEQLSAYKNRKNFMENLFTQLSLIIVTEQFFETRVLILLRQPINYISRDKHVVHVTEKNFNWLNDLKESLVASETGRYTYIICEGEELFGAVGLMNCIKNEAGGRMARLFFIQDKNCEKFDFNSKWFKEQLSKDLIQNIYKNGQWGTFRHLKLDILDSSLPTLPVEHAYVNALTKGDLNSLKWIESPLVLERPESNDPKVDLCTVYYAPINFRDVMLSSGKLAADALPGDLAQQDCILGLEFSGRDSTGKRIMAMVQAKSLATTCVAQKSMMWEIPRNWSMEEASTIPCVYSTVYYALVVRGKMKRGESILIHAGSGGVGQAAISGKKSLIELKFK